MAPPHFDLPRWSRRSLLRNLGIAPLLLRPSPLFGMSLLAAPSDPPSGAPFADGHFVPRYPVRSPLEDVLRLVTAGSDEYLGEKYASELDALLATWAQSLQSGDHAAIQASLSPNLQAASLAASQEIPLRRGGSIETLRRQFSTTLSPAGSNFVQDLAAWLGVGNRAASVKFEITGLSAHSQTPLTFQTRVRFSIALTGGSASREHRTGIWSMEWLAPPADQPTGWKLTRFLPEAETSSLCRGPGFVDITQHALGSIPSFREQMQHGSDHWRTTLDGACGIDVYGNNGVAAGDFDNDGFDDLYVCQPAGLPNRLFRNRGDGTFEDVTDIAGVGVLDNTACALFADFRNVGLQDLLVVCGSGPLLFVNRGDGTFTLRRDAFRFAQPPQGTFTHAAVADYDRDGRLDIYFCLYSYYLGLDQYHYPTPYFDARNGPPNFLLHNEGDGTFSDRTEASGLHIENNRYSFACAWGHTIAGQSPDLYVVNDFGRNNLYRSNGDGTFHLASTEAHVEDVGAGMSACWTDYNNDQRSDLYVANMWSAAGQRVSADPHFHPDTPEALRALYRRHARGNALYRNQGNGTFENVSELAGVEMGGWAWSSDSLDFDHDGFSDLYVTNGYITAPHGLSPASSTAGDASTASTVADLGSFFWRQVVAKSPDDATPSLGYEHGWNALNELIRSDRSWSGLEHNSLLVNNRDGTFTEAAGAVGMDFLEDGRSFALADLDHDGRLEVVLKNRNAPQLRILHNELQEIGNSIVIRLRGTRSNRDAIGAAVTLVAGDLRQTRYVQAGTGFLAQHSKELHFGIGIASHPLHATVQWPSGLVQELSDLPHNSRISLVEGTAEFTAVPFAAPKPLASAQGAPPVEQIPSTGTVETWLIDPLRAPSLSLPDLAGNLQSAESFRGRITLLYFWSASVPACTAELKRLQQHRAALAAAKLNLVAINVDSSPADQTARAVVTREKLSFPALSATPEVAGIYNIIFRYLFDRRRDLPLPTSFLLDATGMIVKCLQGPLPVEQLLRDAQSIPGTAAERQRKALPFPGMLLQSEFRRNDFTYGVAMFQHGYLDQAEESFQQVVAAHPQEAEAYYNLGTLNLRKNNFSKAAQYLQQTIKLKPDYPEAWNNLGMMAAQQGNADEAIRNLQQSLTLRPGYTVALLNLGNVYRRQHRFAEAQSLLQQAVALQPDDPEANYSMGMAFAQQNQLQPASTWLAKAVALRPDYPEALNNLGVLFIRMQDFSKAEQQFRTCIRLSPDFDESYLNLARLFVVQHDTVQARAALEQLLKLHPDSPAGKQGRTMLDALR